MIVDISQNSLMSEGYMEQESNIIHKQLEDDEGIEAVSEDNTSIVPVYDIDAETVNQQKKFLLNLLQEDVNSELLQECLKFLPKERMEEVMHILYSSS